jgi:hypothetical protein
MNLFPKLVYIHSLLFNIIIRSTFFTLLYFTTLCEKNEMGEPCSADGEDRGVYRVLVGKPEGKRPIGRPRHIWEDNIRMDLQEVGCELD